MMSLPPTTGALSTLRRSDSVTQVPPKTRRERIPFRQKKAARSPERPFLSYGGCTLTGDFRTVSPGAYLPACPTRHLLQIGAVAILAPEPTRWSPISVR